MDLPSLNCGGQVAGADGGSQQSGLAAAGSMIDGPTPGEKEGHRLPSHPPCFEECLDLLGSKGPTSDGKRERVLELLAPLDACDAPHLPEPLSLEVGEMHHRRPAVLVAEEP